MISFERSEKEIKGKKEQAFRPRSHFTLIPISHILSRQRQQNYLQFHNQNRTNSNAQKGKLRFVRTPVRVLCLLIVRYTSPMPQIFSKLHKRLRVGGLFAVWMAQRIKHTTEGVKTLTAFKIKLIINKTNVNIIIILLYSCLFGTWKLKSRTTISRGVK